MDYIRSSYIDIAHVEYIANLWETMSEISRVVVLEPHYIWTIRRHRGPVYLVCPPLKLSNYHVLVFYSLDKTYRMSACIFMETVSPWSKTSLESWATILYTAVHTICDQIPFIFKNLGEITCFWGLLFFMNSQPD